MLICLHNLIYLFLTFLHVFSEIFCLFQGSYRSGKVWKSILIKSGVFKFILFFSLETSSMMFYIFVWKIFLS